MATKTKRKRVGTVPLHEHNRLRDELGSLSDEVSALEEQINQLNRTNSVLRAENTSLTKRVRAYEKGTSYLMVIIRSLLMATKLPPEQHDKYMVHAETVFSRIVSDAPVFGDSDTNGEERLAVRLGA